MTFPGQIGSERDGLALDYRIREIGEVMQGVEFSGLDWLKEKDSLRVGEEICAIRQ